MRARDVQINATYTLTNGKFAIKPAKVLQAPANGRHHMLRVLDYTNVLESREAGKEQNSNRE